MHDGRCKGSRKGEGGKPEGDILPAKGHSIFIKGWASGNQRSKEVHGARATKCPLDEQQDSFGYCGQSSFRRW